MPIYIMERTLPVATPAPMVSGSKMLRVGVGMGNKILWHLPGIQLILAQSGHSTALRNSTWQIVL